MGGEIGSDRFLSLLSEIQKRLEGLRTRCIGDPSNVEEILSDVLEQRVLKKLLYMIQKYLFCQIRPMQNIFLEC